MKMLVVLLLICTPSVFAATKKCSNSDGNLRFDFWQYEGGAIPPDDMPLSITKYILFGKEMSEDSGSLQHIEVLEIEENDYIKITKDLVRITISDQTNAYKDIAVCTTRLPKIARP